MWPPLSNVTIQLILYHDNFQELYHDKVIAIQFLKIITTTQLHKYSNKLRLFNNIQILDGGESTIQFTG